MTKSSRRTVERVLTLEMRVPPAQYELAKLAICAKARELFQRFPNDTKVALYSDDFFDTHETLFEAETPNLKRHD